MNYAQFCIYAPPKLINIPVNYLPPSRFMQFSMRLVLLRSFCGTLYRLYSVVKFANFAYRASMVHQFLIYISIRSLVPALFFSVHIELLYFNGCCMHMLPCQLWNARIKCSLAWLLCISIFLGNIAKPSELKRNCTQNMLYCCLQRQFIIFCDK